MNELIGYINAGYEDEIKTFLESPLNLNELYMYESLLHHVVKSKHDVLDYFIFEPALDVNYLNSEGRTPLHFVQNKRQARMLLSHPEIDTLSLDYQDNTALHTVCKYQHNVVDVLLKSKMFDVNKKNDFGNTAAYYVLNDIELLRMFLNYKNFDVNSKNKNGFTLLHCSIVYSLDKELIFLLLNSGADVNLKDNEGNTPLHCFLINELQKKKVDNNIFNALIKTYNSDINARNSNGETMLHLASKLKDHTIVSTLLKLPDINVNLQDKDGKTALFYATFHNLESLKILISWRNIYGAPGGRSANTNDIYSTALGGFETLLHTAIVHRPEACFILLKRRETNINVLDSFNSTPLHIYIKYFNQIKTISQKQKIYLLKLYLSRVDFNPYTQDRDGNTILHIAYKYRANNDVVYYLLTRFNILIRNNKGQAPIDMVRTNGKAGR